VLVSAKGNQNRVIDYCYRKIKSKKIALRGWCYSMNTNKVYVPYSMGKGAWHFQPRPGHDKSEPYSYAGGREISILLPALGVTILRLQMLTVYCGMVRHY
jgi:hypothetical protein